MIRGNNRPAPESAELSAAQKIDAQLNCDIHNRFDIEVVDAATGEVKQRAQAQNVICSQLWTRLMGKSYYFSYIHYGTGAGTPAAADTSLFAFLGAGSPNAADDVFAHDPASGVFSLRKKITLSESTAVGSILSEVGIAYASEASSLCTHAMLKDMNGNTITINKTATDIINIYATVYVHYSATGYDGGSIRIIASPQNAIALSYSNPGGLLMMLASGYSNSETYYEPTAVQVLRGMNKTVRESMPFLSVSSAFSAAEKKIVLSMTRMDAGNYNVAGGIAALMLATVGNVNANMAYSGPAIMLRVGGTWYSGTAITGESIGTGDGSTVDFATDFDAPENATIYVDGVAQTTGVTVQPYPLAYNDLGRYFDGLLPQSTTQNHIVFPFPAPSSLSDSSQVSALETGASRLYYNPYYALGVASVTSLYGVLYASDDLSTWSQIGSGTVSVPAEHQHKKYWKITATESYGAYFSGLSAPTSYVGKNIHFATAPASGAIITADYTTKTIAKDENHVFDLTVTIQLGEPTT